MIKIASIPNDELIFNSVRVIGEVSLLEANYKYRTENLSLNLNCPQIIGSDKKYEKFNLLYKNIASAFCSFCKNNAVKHEKKEAFFGILKFKFTCFDENYISLYIESINNIKGNPVIKRIGQIFDHNTMMLLKTKEIMRSKGIKKKELVDSLTDEYSKKNTEKSFGSIHHLIKSNLNLSNSFMTSSGFRFFFDIGTIAQPESGIIVIPYKLTKI